MDKFQSQSESCLQQLHKLQQASTTPAEPAKGEDKMQDEIKKKPHKIYMMEEGVLKETYSVQ
jgi:hypothetical protein